MGTPTCVSNLTSLFKFVCDLGENISIVSAK